jgi:hypothetical protein
MSCQVGSAIVLPPKSIYSLKEKVSRLCFFKPLKESTTYEPVVYKVKGENILLELALNKNLESLETPGGFHMQVIQKTGSNCSLNV